MFSVHSHFIRSIIGLERLHASSRRSHLCWCTQATSKWRVSFFHHTWSRRNHFAAFSNRSVLWFSPWFQCCWVRLDVGHEDSHWKARWYRIERPSHSLGRRPSWRTQRSRPIPFVELKIPLAFTISVTASPQLDTQSLTWRPIQVTRKIQITQPIKVQVSISKSNKTAFPLLAHTK